ncbi:hypothetical protein D6C77_08866 [Aureobasidium pullulans]|nr:hypothetical protein D6C77_08866 [Aureobasidium pullulans]
MKFTTVCQLLTFGLTINALPNDLRLLRRQDIDFTLIDETADPLTGPSDSRNYNQASAIAAVISDVSNNPLPQPEDGSASLLRRDIVVKTADGYTLNTFLDGSAVNAPNNCNKANTYMGVKLFADGPFDTTLCAAACTAQTNYNLRHPPPAGKATTCQFYNTYEMYKNGAYQGQYCTLYTQAWSTTYATNKGQWRGTDHYTIGKSYIASNATDAGLVSCPGDVVSSSSASVSSSSSAFSSSAASSTSSFASSTSSSASSTSSSVSSASSTTSSISLSITSSSSASSSASSTATCTAIPKVDVQQQAKDQAALDFLFSHNSVVKIFSSFPMSALNSNTITNDLLLSIQAALQNWVPCTAFNVSPGLATCKDRTNQREFVTCITYHTDPLSIQRWGANPSIPLAAVSRTWFDYKNKVIGLDGVALSPDLSLIEVIDRTTPGGLYESKSFLNLLFYYGITNKVYTY